jgi:penicillin-binding protein 2
MIQANGIPRSRFFPLFFLIAAIVFLYLLHLFRLQVLQGSEFKDRAVNISSRSIPIPAPRGEIYDANEDLPLVQNIPSFAVDIIPAEIEDLDATLEELSDILNVPVERLRRRLPSGSLGAFRPREIYSGADFEQIAEIAERNDQLKGVTFHMKPKRAYNITPSMAHILGYVGEINSQEARLRYNEGYTSTSEIGKAGLEYQYEEDLRGIDGSEKRVVDARGRTITSEYSSRTEPIPGHNLILTIDRKIQRVAEEALGNRVGSVVVLRPSTGEILAMVSYPWYNPEIFTKPELRDEYNRIVTDSRSPLLNRAVVSQYAPASTFKIIMTLAALEEQAIDPFQEILCTGSMTLGTGLFHCWNRNGHGYLNLGEALAESCNVYFYTLGTKYLNIDIISDYARRVGYSEPTGIDLPEEALGLVPTPRWKKVRYNQPWVGGDTANTSIGQGFLLVTPLQLANAIAMVTNSGTIYTPHLVKAIKNQQTGEIIREIEPQILKTSSIREETFEETRKYMRKVITEGTARYVITTPSVQVAGKTGTGQVSGFDESFSSWFAAYGPYNAAPEEQVVVVVKTDAVSEGEYEWWAPRATNIIFEAIFTGQDYDGAIKSLNWEWFRNKEPVL